MLGYNNVRVEQTEGLPMLDIRPNRMAMSRIGVTAGDVRDTVTAAIGGREAGLIFEGDRRFPVVIRLSEASHSDLSQVAQIPVPTSGGGFVPLSTVADIAVVNGLNQISRENGKRRVVVQTNVRDRDVAGVVADARAAINAQMKMPPGTYVEWGGQFENLASARDRLLLYSALGSVRDAVIVFTGVPLALIGGVLALVLRDMPFSVSAAVGFIALSGIVVLNGLIMVSSIHDLMARGMDRVRAAHDGALARLRPVAITALVASLGFVPMALGHGAGRGRGPKTAGDRRHRRPDFGYAADPVRLADALCPVRRMEGPGRYDRGRRARSVRICRFHPVLPLPRQRGRHCYVPHPVSGLSPPHVCWRACPNPEASSSRQVAIPAGLVLPSCTNASSPPTPTRHRGDIDSPHPPL